MKAKSMFTMFFVLSMTLTVGLEKSEAREITRSCKAEYRYNVAYAYSKSRRMTLYKFRSEDRSKYFTLRGTGNREMIASAKCRPAFPNRCRRKAAKHLKQCAQENHRDLSKRPSQCKSIQNYPFNLKRILTNNMCRLFKTNIKPGIKEPLKLELAGYMHIWGDKGCGGGLKVKQIVRQIHRNIDCP